MKLGDVLDTVVSIAAAAVPWLPAGTAQTAARVALTALRIGADAARHAADPVATLERLHASSDELAGVEGSWAGALRAKFGDGATP